MERSQRSAERLRGLLGVCVFPTCDSVVPVSMCVCVCGSAARLVDVVEANHTVGLGRGRPV